MFIYMDLYLIITIVNNHSFHIYYTKLILTRQQLFDTNLTPISFNDIIYKKEVLLMAQGQIASNKTRTNITIEKELKSKLEEIAKQENRSFNNLIITILENFISNRER